MSAEPANAGALVYAIAALINQGERDRAKEWVQRALALVTENKSMLYNLSCALVRLGDTDGALNLLESYLATATQSSVDYAEKDSDLDPLRGHSRYQAAISKAHKRLAKPFAGFAESIDALVTKRPNSSTN